MEKLVKLLEQLLLNMRELAAVLSDEQSLLCAGHVDGPALQVITDRKSSLLTTIQHLDKIRLQGESALRVKAPYSSHPTVAQVWQQIAELSEALRDKNQHNGLLLGYHLDHNEKALAVLKPRHAQSLYGPDGQSRSNSISGRRISI
ncbi:flagella synthesis protein FlgN [Dickeya zeae]|uniref:Flagellar biosynthesis protein FlgN n=1 Tax=Dickeya zeae TaxID=204042 RepID=A0AAE7CYA2_9GAMM|nr:flagellar export chaperone FlgN [Dickeya zeae]QIZ50706.1 flagellar biosynthesis protein FlgN [Dickeya zeae]QYM90501.1 flagellar biosynthesis protein FlgN [Dickeya zeae]